MSLWRGACCTAGSVKGDDQVYPAAKHLDPKAPASMHCSHSGEPRPMITGRLAYTLSQESSREAPYSPFGNHNIYIDGGGNKVWYNPLSAHPLTLVEMGPTGKDWGGSSSSGPYDGGINATLCTGSSGAALTYSTNGSMTQDRSCSGHGDRCGKLGRSAAVSSASTSRVQGYHTLRFSALEPNITSDAAWQKTLCHMYDGRAVVHMQTCPPTHVDSAVIQHRKGLLLSLPMQQQEQQQQAWGLRSSAKGAGHDLADAEGLQRRHQADMHVGTCRGCRRDMALCKHPKLQWASTAPYGQPNPHAEHLKHSTSSNNSQASRLGATDSCTHSRACSRRPIDGSGENSSGEQDDAESVDSFMSTLQGMLKEMGNAGGAGRTTSTTSRGHNALGQRASLCNSPGALEPGSSYGLSDMSSIAQRAIDAARGALPSINASLQVLRALDTAANAASAASGQKPLQLPSSTPKAESLLQERVFSDTGRRGPLATADIGSRSSFSSQLAAITQQLPGRYGLHSLSGSIYNCWGPNCPQASAAAAASPPPPSLQPEFASHTPEGVSSVPAHSGPASAPSAPAPATGMRSWPALPSEAPVDDPTFLVAGSLSGKLQSLTTLATDTVNKLQMYMGKQEPPLPPHGSQDSAPTSLWRQASAPSFAPQPQARAGAPPNAWPLQQPEQPWGSIAPRRVLSPMSHLPTPSQQRGTWAQAEASGQHSCQRPIATEAVSTSGTGIPVRSCQLQRAGNKALATPRARTTTSSFLGMASALERRMRQLSPPGTFAPSSRGSSGGGSVCPGTRPGAMHLPPALASPLVRQWAYGSGAGGRRDITEGLQLWQQPCHGVGSTAEDMASSYDGSGEDSCSRGNTRAATWPLSLVPAVLAHRYASQHIAHHSDVAHKGAHAIAPSTHLTYAKVAPCYSGQGGSNLQYGRQEQALTYRHVQDLSMHRFSMRGLSLPQYSSSNGSAMQDHAQHVLSSSLGGQPWALASNASFGVSGRPVRPNSFEVEASGGVGQQQKGQRLLPEETDSLRSYGGSVGGTEASQQLWPPQHQLHANQPDQQADHMFGYS